MLGLRKALERSSLVTCGALCLGLSHCGGTEFSAGASGAGAGAAAGSGPGGTASVAGASGAATGGAAGSNGNAGMGGVGGDKGGGPSSCDCASGSYCLEGSTDCLACSNLGRLYFEQPVRLATVSDNGPGSRFPRTGVTRTDLLYRFEGVGLRYTTDSSTSAGMNVAATEPQDRAPLLLQEPVTTLPTEGLSQFNFLFDRTVGDLRTLRLGSWNDGLRTTAAAPPPLDGAAGDFSVAVALRATPASARAFWMTNRQGALPSAPKPRLVTALLETAASAVDVTLKLSVSGDDDECAPLDVSQRPSGKEPVDPDLTPWVTPDGTLLVLSTTRLEPDCAEGTQKKDIYAALLQPATGQPPDPALPMKDVNSPQDDVDPSFSADLCELYFASNRDGEFAVYRARRR